MNTSGRDYRAELLHKLAVNTWPIALGTLGLGVLAGILYFLVAWEILLPWVAIAIIAVGALAVGFKYAANIEITWKLIQTILPKRN